MRSLCSPLLVAALAGCAAGGGDTAAAEGHLLAYELAWDASGIEVEAGGWRATTDLGYEVRVTGGSLGDLRAQLAPCYAAGWSLISAAYADHAGDELNASAVEASVVEDLASPADRFFGAVVSADAWCSGEYVIAPAAVAEDPAMVGLTLRMSFEHRAPGARGWTAAEIASDRTFRAYTALRDSGGSTMILDSNEGDATVTIRRPLAALFDGIDLATAGEDAIAEGVAANLVSGARLVVTP